MQTQTTVAPSERPTSTDKPVSAQIPALGIGRGMAGIARRMSKLGAL